MPVLGTEHPIGSVALIPGGGGIFDVALDDRLIFSKSKAGRHALEGEIVSLIRKQMAS
jgi:selenoprotein W-related protein